MGRIDTRLTVEGVNLKPGVIGKAVNLEMASNVAGFLAGVAGNSTRSFGQFVGAADVGEGQNLKRPIQRKSDFLDLVGVVGGEAKLFHGAKKSRSAERRTARLPIFERLFNADYFNVEHQ